MPIRAQSKCRSGDLSCDLGGIPADRLNVDGKLAPAASSLDVSLPGDRVLRSLCPLIAFSSLSSISVSFCCHYHFRAPYPALNQRHLTNEVFVTIFWRLS